MAVAVSLDPATLRVVPGEPVELTLTVRNDSTIVEGYFLRAVGELAAQVTITPDRLSIYPGKTETALVRVSVARSADVPAGEVGLGIQVNPTAIGPGQDADGGEEGGHGAVAEATLSIEPFAAVDAEIVPRISRSRGRKRVRLAVDNNGNAPFAAALIGQASDRLKVVPRETDVWVDAGHATFVSVGLVPRRRVWRGQAVSHPYTVTVMVDGADPLVIDGTHVQEPVFPSWFWKALLALLALIALLILLWNLLLKPTVEDAAREAVAEPMAEAVEAAQAAEEAALGAADAAGAAQEAAESVGATPAPQPPEPTETTENYPLALTAPKGESATAALPSAVPDGSVLEITDLVINNPQGDVGTLRLSSGDTTLIFLGTENYRDLDLHFVSPIQIPGGSTLTATMECVQPGRPPGRTPDECLANILVTATLVTEAD